MAMTKYHRTFELQSAHFNGEHAYAIFNQHRESQAPMEWYDYMTLLKDCHGHNFKIVVEVLGNHEEKDAWLIDDVKMTKVVMEWDNINLSVHEDFKDIRATTENMATVLLDKLRDAFPGKKITTVTVHENNLIHATAWNKPAD